MLEARIGYFEASRHILVAFQKLLHEKFALQKHIVELDNDIGTSEFLKKNPIMNINCLGRAQDDLEGLYDSNFLDDVDVLHSFPHIIPGCGMDTSQLAACKRILTKQLAMVQGPPGTGKTFTSVSALRAMIENMKPGEPPIIIAAQTNHALDQLLNHILVFERAIVRLGGRSSFENTTIRQRTLYNLRLIHRGQVPQGSYGMKRCYAALDSIKEALKTAILPLLSEQLLTDDILRRHGLITEFQQSSLYETGWVSADCDGTIGGETATKIGQWLGVQIMAVPCTPRINFDLQLEEYDDDLRQQHPEELATLDNNKEDMDGLMGEAVNFQRKFTGTSSATVESRKIQNLLKRHKNLYDIPVGMRGSIYRYWEKKLDNSIRENVVEILRGYDKVVKDLKITKVSFLR
jgi:helicase required for RNAi-mediated heterochromatin assembly 1